MRERHAPGFAVCSPGEVHRPPSLRQGQRKYSLARFVRSPRSLFLYAPPPLLPRFAFFGALSLRSRRGSLASFPLFSVSVTPPKGPLPRARPPGPRSSRGRSRTSNCCIAATAAGELRRGTRRISLSNESREVTRSNLVVRRHFAAQKTDEDTAHSSSSVSNIFLIRNANLLLLKNLFSNFYYLSKSDADTF